MEIKYRGITINLDQSAVEAYTSQGLDAHTEITKSIDAGFGNSDQSSFPELVISDTNDISNTL